MARKTIARYAVMFGLSGCYMPDSHHGFHEFATRSALADFIRDELSFYDMPKKCFRDVGIIALWKFFKRNGSSSAHFSLRHGDYALSFHGLTEEEYNNECEAENV